MWRNPQETAGSPFDANDCVHTCLWLMIVRGSTPHLCLSNFLLVSFFNKVFHDGLLRKSIDWFLHDRDLHHERVKYSQLKTNRQRINPSRPDPGQKGKINLKFYFHTSLWCLKGFMEALKTFIKPFEGPQRSVKIKISVNFYFNTTFWN